MFEQKLEPAKREALIAIRDIAGRIVKTAIDTREDGDACESAMYEANKACLKILIARLVDKGEII